MCATFTVATAIAELAWHESSRIDIAREPRLVVAMTLALAVPAFLAFAASVLAVRSRWTARNRALAAVATAVPAVALYPLYALYLVCYVGHDCI